jgi:hypothetical protein
VVFGVYFKKTKAKDTLLSKFCNSVSLNFFFFNKQSYVEVVFLSLGYYNTVYTRWLQTTEMSFVTVLEAGSLRSKCQ